jgi:hypothetical protein
MTVHDFGSGTLYVGDCRESLRMMKEQGYLLVFRRHK